MPNTAFTSSYYSYLVAWFLRYLPQSQDGKLVIPCNGLGTSGVCRVVGISEELGNPTHMWYWNKEKGMV